MKPQEYAIELLAAFAIIFGGAFLIALVG